MTQDNVTTIGSGGRLYKDARDKDSPARDKDDSPTVPHPHADRPEPLASRGPSRPPRPPEPKPKPVQRKVIEEPKVPRDWRAIISTAVELLGVAVLTGGFWLIRPWAGLIVLGMCLVIMGIGLGMTGPIQRRPRSQ